MPLAALLPIRLTTLTVLAALLGCACSARAPTVPAAPAAEPRTATPAPSKSPTPSRTPSVAPSRPPASPAVFDAAAAGEVVRLLAGSIGPREAGSAAYRRAADVVAARLAGYGYAVSRQPVRVPAGVSWGVPVGAGRTWNVVATAPGFRGDRPHRLVGAHLDTVPQAPGAEDNASGVGVLLELARMAQEQPPDVPVVFVAFGGEEPRGSGDDRHHFGSQQMVRTMAENQRDALLGMVSLDRVGVRSDTLPVCHGGQGSASTRAAVLRAAERVGIPARTCTNRASDHWSFEKAGVSSARIGSVPYAEYHSARDLPPVVDPTQLRRAGRVAWEWLRSPS